MPVNVTIDGVEYKNVKELEMFGAVWRPATDVIDKPTETLEIVGNGDYDVTRYAKVKARFLPVQYSNLQVTLSSQKIVVGSTVEDIRNLISSATVTQAAGGALSTISIEDMNLINITLPIGGTIVSGSNLVSFNYQQANTSAYLTGFEGTATVKSSTTGTEIVGIGSNNSMEIVENSLSFTLRAQTGYQFFSSYVTIKEKLTSGSQPIDITNTRCTISFIDPENISIKISNAQNGAEYTVSAVATALSECATIKITCNHCRLAAPDGSKIKIYTDIVPASGSPSYSFEPDPGYLFDSNSTHYVVPSTGTTDVTFVPNQTGAVLRFNSLTKEVTYNTGVTAAPVASVYLSGINIDKCSIEGIIGTSGKLPIDAQGNVSTKLKVESGYSALISIYKNNAVYSNWSQNFTETGYDIAVKYISPGDQISVVVSVSKLDI
nr:MAG TPA: hypothetical protein [Caudoviricetes sp.]